MKNEKQAKLSKLYRGDAFVGFGLSVDGVLLSNQTLLRIEHSNGRHPPQVTVVFNSHKDLTVDAPDIHLK
ncbi:hypothetical protein AB7250_20015 [Providencia stuartii]|uniref:hypothetical protein n=1 Tax=Providencia TaxID=586 RepID=UPI000538AFDB|nr:MULTISPECIES: hypothetical protein [Providencia]AXO17616.1 hypothetical protein MC79_002970 [Providencia stuartii]MBQ0456193.1 hypothetical protein [Providencia stuartii]MDN7223889.1 hypothetical protein [Providencia stuartii]MDT1068461.1 hypothetical protein [Providencia stuartii]MTC82403.1 hypothetical protein [Providencia stuartii]